MMKKVTKDELYEKYITESKPMHTVAKELNISVGSVYNYIVKYEIPSRERHKGFLGKHHTEEAKKKISEKTSGKVISDETKRKMSKSKRKGGIGHKKKRQDGYVAVYFPDHPCSNADGYIMEHDLVMECLIGRHLHEYEVVHHINEERSDNRKENLQLMTKSNHMSYHSKKRHEKRRNDLSIR